MTIRRHRLVGGAAFCAAFAEALLASSWLGILPTFIPAWLTNCLGLICWSGPFLLFIAGLLLVFAKDFRNKKKLLILSVGCFFIATAHCVLSYIIAEAIARAE